MNIVADVIDIGEGVLMCDCCGTGIIRDELGNLPDHCPACGCELDYRDLECCI